MSELALALLSRWAASRSPSWRSQLHFRLQVSRALCEAAGCLDSTCSNRSLGLPPRGGGFGGGLYRLDHSGDRLRSSRLRGTERILSRPGEPAASSPAFRVVVTRPGRIPRQPDHRPSRLLSRGPRAGRAARPSATWSSMTRWPYGAICPPSLWLCSTIPPVRAHRSGRGLARLRESRSSIQLDSGPHADGESLAQVARFVLPSRLHSRLGTLPERLAANSARDAIMAFASATSKSSARPTRNPRRLTRPRVGLCRTKAPTSVSKGPRSSVRKASKRSVVW